jgi:hypothetical protein
VCCGVAPTNGITPDFTVVGDGVQRCFTNPTIFAKAIGAGSGYEDQLRDLALRGTAIGETLRLLTAWDVRAACDILRPVYDRTAARDGRVSIEVDPRISGDADRTAAEARGLWWLVDRPNLFIKIPATLACLPADGDAVWWQGSGGEAGSASRSGGSRQCTLGLRNIRADAGI